MTTHHYSHECDPPGPIVPIRISTLEEPSTMHEKSALLDSGADICGIPPRVIDELNIKPSGYERIETSGGKIEWKPTYTLNLEFNGIPFTDHLFFEFADEGYLLLGRDVINHFHICLDGVNLIVDVHDNGNQE